MRRKRPCRICGCWFIPNMRAGNRQKVCSRPSCQRERHRRNCANWRRRNPHHDREGRLRDKLRSDSTRSIAPMAQIDWEAARDSVGLEAAVLTEEMAEVVVNWTRDLVARQPIESKEKSTKEVPSRTRDAIERPSKPP